MQDLAATLKSLNLKTRIDRLDNLLASAPPDSSEKLGLALGIRLALGMALEIKNGKSLGSESGEMIAVWVKKYGEEPVEAAVQTARTFLKNPGKLREKLEQKLFGRS
jgi:hypothetical protein